uniref:Uncharacterized protein n=1 Tax=Anguilla anguilla TaxID=7936 RepID=A0A0E9SBQ6_ANGAN
MRERREFHHNIAGMTAPKTSAARNR